MPSTSVCSPCYGCFGILVIVENKTSNKKERRKQLTSKRKKVIQAIEYNIWVFIEPGDECGGDAN